MNLPKYALSIRQPWAWAILHRGKNLENRSRRMLPKTEGGLICIHASSWKPSKEPMGRGYWDFTGAIKTIEEASGEPVPEMFFSLGCIIGTCRITGYVTEETADGNPWFMGKYGLIIEDAKPLEGAPIPCKGRLGYFKWREGQEEGSLI